MCKQSKEHNQSHKGLPWIIAKLTNSTCSEVNQTEALPRWFILLLKWKLYHVNGKQIRTAENSSELTYPTSSNYASENSESPLHVHNSNSKLQNFQPRIHSNTNGEFTQVTPYNQEQTQMKNILQETKKGSPCSTT